MYWFSDICRIALIVMIYLAISFLLMYFSDSGSLLPRPRDNRNDVLPDLPRPASYLHTDQEPQVFSSFLWVRQRASSPHVHYLPVLHL